MFPILLKSSLVDEANLTRTQRLALILHGRCLDHGMRLVSMDPQADLSAPNSLLEQMVEFTDASVSLNLLPANWQSFVHEDQPTWFFYWMAGQLYKLKVEPVAEGHAASLIGGTTLKKQAVAPEDSLEVNAPVVQTFGLGLPKFNLSVPALEWESTAWPNQGNSFDEHLFRPQGNLFGPDHPLFQGVPPSWEKGRGKRWDPPGPFGGFPDNPDFPF